ncbi:outer membrane protein [Ketogulonicigenium robustum]|uniref:Outer membrane protein n=1 Tax=Ketogulonicigenium robustum TaxID=92947 RepID=A0A1W6NZ34_9RHOB|nr:porin family protein [Ketogulonicigenium robustum]ARO14413.1 outer membrane protein [Ketogulonicigenium robustum]
MRYLYIAALLASTSAFAANAGGLATPVIEPVVAPVVVVQPAAAPTTWQGGYLGLNASYGDSSLDAVDPYASALSSAGLGKSIAELDGGNYAVRGGFDWQSNSWIFGIGAEYNFGEYKGNLTDAFATAAGINADVELNSVTTAFFRAGYTFNANTALYGLLGYTWATGEATVSGVTESEDFEGVTYGIGLEHKFSSNWSVYGEYAYTDLGELSDPTIGDLAEVDLGQIKIGVNFRF